MVDSWYCLDPVVPEGMSQVSRWSEVAYINGAPSAPGYLLKLLRELSHVPRGLTEIAEAKQVWKTNQTGILYQFKKRGLKVDPHVSNLRSRWFLFQEVQVHPAGGVGYFSNERRFSVESSLQRIASNLLLWKRYDSSVVFLTWSWRGNPAASAWARLRKANAERLEIIFATEYAIRSWYQNLEETEIWVCARFGYLRKENRCTMPNSDFFCERNTFFFRKSPLRSGSLFAITQKVYWTGSRSPLHFDFRNM